MGKEKTVWAESRFRVLAHSTNTVCSGNLRDPGILTFSFVFKDVMKT